MSKEDESRLIGLALALLFLAFIFLLAEVRDRRKTRNRRWTESTDRQGKTREVTATGYPLSTASFLAGETGDEEINDLLFLYEQYVVRSWRFQPHPEGASEKIEAHILSITQRLRGGL